MLHLLIDTSVWLDLAKRRDGQKLIHALGQVILDGDVELLVPALVIEEFGRNRGRIEQTMTTSVADRFKLLQKDLETLSGDWHRPGFDAINALAYEMPLIGAMATRNFRDIRRRTCPRDYRRNRPFPPPQRLTFRLRRGLERDWSGNTGSRTGTALHCTGVCPGLG